MPNPDNLTPPPIEQQVKKVEKIWEIKTPVELVKKLIKSQETLVDFNNTAGREDRETKNILEGLKAILGFFEDCNFTEPLPEHYQKITNARRCLEQALLKLINPKATNPKELIDELNLILLVSALKNDIKNSK